MGDYANNQQSETAIGKLIDKIDDNSLFDVAISDYHPDGHISVITITKR